MTRQNLIAFFFAALLIFILYSTFLIFSPFFRPIFWSAVIAFGFYPLYDRLLKRLNGAREAAAFLTTLAIFIVFIPVVVFLVMSLIHEVGGIYDWMLNSLNQGGLQAVLDRIHSISWVQKIERSQFFQQDFMRENFQNMLLKWAQSVGRLALQEAAMITKNTLAGVVNFAMTIFLVFFFLKDGERFFRFVYRVTPLEEHIKHQVFTRLGETFSAVLRGQIVTALAQAALAGAIFWFLGLPLPLFFAALTFMCAMIPLFGAALVWAPMALYLYITKQYFDATVLVILGVFVISLVDNFLKPLLIGEKTKLPYLLLFLGILGGMQVYGLMGIFLAPVVLSLFFVLIKIYQEEILAEK